MKHKIKDSNRGLYNVDSISQQWVYRTKMSRIIIYMKETHNKVGNHSNMVGIIIKVNNLRARTKNNIQVE